jgi:adenylate cyclase
MYCRSCVRGTHAKRGSRRFAFVTDPPIDSAILLNLELPHKPPPLSPARAQRRPIQGSSCRCAGVANKLFPVNGSSFLVELKRRRVVRVAFAYVVVGAAVGQAADVFLPALGLPDWSLTLVVAVLVLGLPVAVSLAWALQVTPEGVSRDRGTAVGAVGVALPVAEAVPSIAVLPFVDMSPDNDQGYFGDGLAEELISALTRLQLRVAARTSTFTLAKRGAAVSKIAGELGVRHVLEGSVRKSGNRLRVTAQLIGAQDGYHLWSEAYERELGDVFAIQDDIARAVVSALRVHLAGTEGPLVPAPTKSSEAYDFYLKGRHLWRLRYQHGMAAALPSFERAIELDSRYALPYTGIADTYTIFGLYGFVTAATAAAKAAPALRRALELGPHLPQSHFSDAYYRLSLALDLTGAERAARRALELEPQYADALVLLAVVQSCMGRLAESLETAEAAAAIDPYGAYVAEMGAMVQAFAWRFEEAVAACNTVLSLEPRSVIARFLLAVALSALGRHMESLDAWTRVLELAHGQPTFRAWRIYDLFAAGEGDQALEELRALEMLREREGLPAQVLFQACASAGRPEEAFRWLDIAEREEGGAPILTFAGQVSFNPVRRDARFRNRVRRLGIRDDAWLAMMEV